MTVIGVPVTKTNVGSAGSCVIVKNIADYAAVQVTIKSGHHVSTAIPVRFARQQVHDGRNFHDER